MKKMKDRDMHNVKVYFEIHGALDPHYYLRDIVQPNNKITETYIANFFLKFVIIFFSCFI